jgi:hypothetical protein
LFSSIFCYLFLSAQFFSSYLETQNRPKQRLWLFFDGQDVPSPIDGFEEDQDFGCFVECVGWYSAEAELVVREVAVVFRRAVILIKITDDL